MTKSTGRAGLVILIPLFVTMACGGGDGGGGPSAREWTVMIYLAGDNNLTVDGVFDVDEMEAAGADARVQVVVQAEYSPTYIQLANCDPSCFNRPNYNTFRYAITGQGAAVTGPNGAVQDIGNRDMTDPAQLREFVQWAKQNYPANRYALVLWNHGGGYTGLIEDATSAGSQLMSLGELVPALTGVGPVDIIDFDMCLMAGYETLATLSGLARYVVFSEEVVPGAGNPYTQILDALQANPTATTAAVASAFVEQFHASYAGDRASTTKSAYDMAAFAAFDTDLNALADSLRSGLGTYRTAVAGAAAASQRYHLDQLVDVVNLLDSLRVRVASPTLVARIDAVRTRGVSAFRVNSRARNGSAVSLGGQGDVLRSTGLNILLPSVALANSGPESFTAYQALYPGKSWTLFLADYLTGQGTAAHRDQGNARFEGYLVWDENAVAAGADADMWILEPNGDLFIPYLGSVTPNGVLTNDSYDDGTFYEGYLTNRFLEIGVYKFYANLWRDPSTFHPLYDLVYRNDQTSAFVSLYAPNYPQLTTSPSWLNDPTPTFGEIESGAYGDLQFAATLTITLLGAASLRNAPATPAGVAGARNLGPEITAPQLDLVRRLVRERGEAGTAGAAGSGLRRGTAALPTPAAGRRP